MLLPIPTTPNTTHYGTIHLMSVDSIASMACHLAYYCNLKDSNRITVVRLFLVLSNKRTRLMTVIPVTYTL